MNLANLQKSLFNLVQGSRDDLPDDTYLHQVADSPHLELVHEITRWWLSLGLEQFCKFTSKLLKRLELFDSAVNDCIHHGPNSPQIDEMGRAFLRLMGDHQHSLVAAMARFENALILVKGGIPQQFVIDWPTNPYPILESLIEGTPIDETETKERYQTIVGRDFPGFFQVAILEG